jgi:arylsulfatase A-like enzyme
VKPAVSRVDAHVGAVVRALRDVAGEQATVVVTGDHGFQDVRRLVFPNAALSKAGLRGCPRAGEAWRATVHVAGGAAAVFVNPPDDAPTAARAEEVLRRDARGRYTVLGRADLDALGAMTGAALGIEAAPGYAVGGSCARGATASSTGGSHGFLPSRATMATGFVAAGAGVRAGVMLDRIRLVDVAPTVARLLGLAPPPVEGRVLEEIVR